MSNSRTTKNSGFTLLELMAAIFVIIIGVIGALSALQRATSTTFVSSSKLTASYLAQEGIEIVRNIRDANWLEIHKGLKLEELWDDNIFCCGASPCECQADYSSEVLDGWNDEFLEIDGGFYSYSGTDDTKFKRKITVEKTSADVLEVSVEVSWQERGKDFQVTAQENLYNWK